MIVYRYENIPRAHKIGLFSESSQHKVYGPSGIIHAGPAGKTLICIYSGLHNMEVNPEAPQFLQYIHGWASTLLTYSHPEWYTLKKHVNLPDVHCK